MLTRERESSRRCHAGIERNPPGYGRTPNDTATNRERVPPRQKRRNPLWATVYRDHAARPRCGVADDGIGHSLSRKPVQLRRMLNLRNDPVNDRRWDAEAPQLRSPRTGGGTHRMYAKQVRVVAGLRTQASVGQIAERLVGPARLPRDEPAIRADLCVTSVIRSGPSD